MREPDNPTAADFRRRAHQRAQDAVPSSVPESEIGRLRYVTSWLAAECAGLAADNRKLRRELSELQEAPLHDARLKALNGALQLTEAALAKGSEQSPSREARLQELARAAGEADAPDGLALAMAVLDLECIPHKGKHGIPALLGSVIAEARALIAKVEGRVT